MSEGKNTGKRTITRRIPPVLGVVVILAIVVTVGSFGYTATLEENDSFCISCHTQPESTYYQRAQDAQPVDLASFHATQPVHCIACHSGRGLPGRIGAELVGARNALMMVTGRATQPAVLITPIGDGSCLKCHDQVTANRGRDNHFHAFLSRWQLVDRNAGHCVSCHSGHVTDGASQDLFLNAARTDSVCNACHAVLREGGGGD